MGLIQTKSEIQNEIDQKNSSIEAKQTEVTELCEKIGRLTVAYNRIQLIAEEFVELYPDESVVLQPILEDDTLWRGCTRDSFRETIYDVYSESVSKLMSDIFDSRDFISIETGQLQDRVDSLNWDITMLEADVDVLKLRKSIAPD